MSAPSPIKILFLAANPLDTTRLQIDEEMRAIDQALRMADYRDRFDLRTHSAVSYRDLQELLLRHKPHIVHFSGHGSQAGELILQHEGGIHPVSAEAISALFAILKDNLRCVVLNACYSELQARAIAAHIDCVIGMSDAIDDVASLHFASAFYLALGYGRTVQEAFDLGCNAIGLANRTDQEIPHLLGLHGAPNEVVFIDTAVTETTPAPGEPPYKGLQFFDVNDVGIFFGRERLTAEVVAYLNRYRFLAVVGASGSGKSSLVRAGVVPALQRDEPLIEGITPPQGSGRWLIHIITPTAHPLKALAATLTRGSESVRAQVMLMDDLAADERSLDLYVNRLLSNDDHIGRGASDRLLLVVDQFEETFSLCRDQAERRMFINNLLTASAEDGVTTVIITLRADFYAHCAAFDNLRAALERYQRYIGPMTAAELRRAIEEPARLGNWEFELGLVNELLSDVGAGENHQPEPGALPLLSHALLETWKRRRGRMMTLAGYVESGKVEGAIAQTAERVYKQLPPEQQTITRNIFVRLTEFGEGIQDTRRRIALEELLPQSGQKEPVAAVLKMLIDARLVTTDEDEAEVAHEALIREWPTLRQWLAEDREGLHLHRRLTEAAQEWEALKHDEGALYRGTRLAQALEWATDHTVDLNEQEQAFLDASQKAEQRTANRLRQFVIFLGVASIIAIGAAIFAGISFVNERLAREEAQARLLVNQGRFDYEDDPLLGLRLALEGWTLVRDHDQAIQDQMGASVRDLVQQGRFLKVGENIENIYVVGNESVLLLDQSSAPGELHTIVDNQIITDIAGSIDNVYLSPDAANTYMVVDYRESDLASELWDGADGLLIGHLAERLASIYYSPDETASYMLVSSYPGPGEPEAQLLQTASGLAIAALPHRIASVRFSPSTPPPYFIVTYDDYFGNNDYASELRRTADGSLIETLPGIVRDFNLAPDETKNYLVIGYSPNGWHRTGELRRAADASLILGDFSEIYLSPDKSATYAVLTYENKPSELRRTADGSLVKSLGSNGYWAQFSPNTDVTYFVVVDDRRAELRRTADGSVVQTLQNADSKVYFSQDESATYFSINSYPGPIASPMKNELRRAVDGSLIASLEGGAENVHFLPYEAPTYYVIDYGYWIALDRYTAPGELRRTLDGSLIETLPGQIEKVQLGWDKEHSYFLIEYGQEGIPDELRSADDGSLLETLTGSIESVYLNSSVTAPYFVLAYNGNVAGELRSIQDGSLLQTLAGPIAKVDFSPDEAATYLLVQYTNNRTELWYTGDPPQLIAKLGIALNDHQFAFASNRLIIQYIDGQVYSVDLPLAHATGSDLDQLYAAMVHLLCQEPFRNRLAAEKILEEYSSEQLRACN